MRALSVALVAGLAFMPASGLAIPATFDPTPGNSSDPQFTLLQNRGATQASWALSALSPDFSVNPTATNFTLPTTGLSFAAAAAPAVSPEPPPIGVVPEPATMILIGSALIGLGLFCRRHFTRP